MRMNQEHYSSPQLESAVDNLSKLPGIGRKTALRLALHLLRRPEGQAAELARAIEELHTIRYCKVCHNISDTDICPICADNRRGKDMICVVENVKDVMAIEATGEYRGRYHVLGGLISPLDGIAPSDLEIESLVRRVENEHMEEVILALSPTLEGDTTAFYIYRRLQNCSDTRVTILARGVAVGNDLELTDTLTLGRSLQNRIPYTTTDEQ